jgi:hypothetical protein
MGRVSFTQELKALPQLAGEGCVSSVCAGD